MKKPLFDPIICRKESRLLSHFSALIGTSCPWLPLLTSMVMMGVLFGAPVAAMDQELEDAPPGYGCSPRLPEPLPAEWQDAIDTEDSRNTPAPEGNLRLSSQSASPGRTPSTDAQELPVEEPQRPPNPADDSTEKEKRIACLKLQEELLHAHIAALTEDPSTVDMDSVRLAEKQTQIRGEVVRRKNELDQELEKLEQNHSTSSPESQAYNMRVTQYNQRATLYEKICRAITSRTLEGKSLRATLERQVDEVQYELRKLLSGKHDSQDSDSTY